MKIHLLGFLVICFLASCVKEEGLPPGLRGEAFKLADDKKHALVIDEMSNQSIPFEIDERGWVNYMQKDLAKVLGIKRKALLYGSEPTTRVIESRIIMDTEDRQLLTSKFEQQGIPYNIDTFNGVEHIRWVQLYGPKVDQIIQDVGFERYRNATNK